MPIEKLKETIIAGLEQTFPAKRGLETLVFGNADEQTFNTESIQIDIFDGEAGKWGAANYTARGSKGQTLGLQGWETITVRPPLIDENFVIGAADMKLRDYAKSNINAPIGEKFQMLANKQMVRTKDRRQARYNLQIAELITSGKVTIVEYDDKGKALAPRVEDFKMPASHVYTVAIPWNDGVADIFADMREIGSLIVKDSGLTVTDAVVGETTLSDMLGNDKIQKLIDNRRMKFGDIEIDDKGDGLIYWGVVFGVKIWTFTEFKADGSPLIPESAYIPFSNKAEKDIYYGSIDAMVGGVPTVVEGKMVIYDKADDESVSVKQGMKSAKLYAITQSAAFGHLTTR